MKKYNPTCTLVKGCDVISQRLGYSLSPAGSLYKFNDKTPRRPAPLTLGVVLMNCALIALVLVFNLCMYRESKPAYEKSERFKLVSQSKFLFRLSYFYEIYRLIFYCASIIIVIVQHGVIANIMATDIFIVNRREQTRFARRAFSVFLIKTLCNLVTFLFIIWSLYKDGGDIEIMENPELFLLCPCIILVTNLSFFTPLMLACYLGASLGRHVENFSKLYIDTMFDQFIKTSDNESVCRMPILKRSDDDSVSLKSASINWLNPLGLCCSIATLFTTIKNSFIQMGKKFMEIIRLFNSREYPELPEMEMTKISLSVDVKISEFMRSANSRLIRIRLEKTQNMLSELRDMVSDINKMSSPLILLLFIAETGSIILVTTASIQAKLYRSASLMIVPTVSSTLGLTIGVIYICICLDATTSQLKLMINKLFDFIIMNHRMQISDKDLQQVGDDGLISDEARKSLYNWNKEDKDISETWSQFQYTRKLAGTIQFTIGGILQVNRRLVLVVLGHILSAVFISIEIMSIMDTAGHSKKPLNLAGATFQDALN